jgi:hypothetical protein
MNWRDFPAVQAALITAWPMVIDMFLQEPLPVTGQSYAKGIRTHYEPCAELRTSV